MARFDPEAAFAAALADHQAGRLAAAEQAYRRILGRYPEHTDALNLLGVIALQSGDAAAALKLLSRAVALRPDGAIYHNNLGQVQERLDRRDAAEVAYREALALDPGYAEAANNLGHLLSGAGELTEAEAFLREAIRLTPNYADPWINLGNLHKDRGDLDAAIDSYRAAIRLRPELSMFHSNLLLTIHYHDGFSPADIAAEHARWAKRHVARYASHRAPHDNSPDPGRRLRIGYLSPDFREHSVAHFLLPLLAHQDRSQVEIFLYADVTHPDAVTASAQRLADEWRDVCSLTDAQVAEQVRADRIDVLFDLAAHTGRNRLPVFARKPAPVQATYLAYCSTTGVDVIDYRLTDRFLDPPGTEAGLYAEESVWLPDGYWCYTPPGETAVVVADDLALHDGPPRFGCLNNFAKVTDRTLELWAELLCRVPDAQLLLYARAEAHRRRARGVFEAAGVDPDRLRFVGWQSRQDYLGTYKDIDICLDPYPYGGGTTTLDALWMGVPVVSLAGATAVSRAGRSILSNLGLAELATDSPAAYIGCAAELIGDRGRLATLRAELRPRLEASPLMDVARFARGFDALIRDMWVRWCRTQAA